MLMFFFVFFFMFLFYSKTCFLCFFGNRCYNIYGNTQRVTVDIQSIPVSPADSHAVDRREMVGRSTEWEGDVRGAVQLVVVLWH